MYYSCMDPPYTMNTIKNINYKYRTRIPHHTSCRCFVAPNKTQASNPESFEARPAKADGMANM